MNCSSIPLPCGSTIGLVLVLLVIFDRFILSFGITEVIGACACACDDLSISISLSSSKNKNKINSLSVHSTYF